MTNQAKQDQHTVLTQDELIALADANGEIIITDKSEWDLLVNEFSTLADDGIAVVGTTIRCIVKGVVLVIRFVRIAVDGLEQGLSYSIRETSDIAKSMQQSIDEFFAPKEAVAS